MRVYVFAMNLAAARRWAKEFLRWHEKRLIGVSLTTVIPLGQNDRARIINIGSNRWAFKPEIGFTRKWQRVIVEGYTGIWLFTSNTNFYPGDAKRTQDPIVAFEAHAGYYIKPRLWASFDSISGWVDVPRSTVWENRTSIGTPASA